MPQVPWVIRYTGFAMQTISFAYFLVWLPLGHIASWSCLQCFWSPGAGRHSPQWEGLHFSISLPANSALGLVKLLIWGSESGISAPCWVLRSECAHSLVLQMSKASGWDYYLGTAGMNLVCKETCAGCCKPLPLLHHSQIPRGWVPGFPCNSRGVRSE